MKEFWQKPNETIDDTTSYAKSLYWTWQFISQWTHKRLKKYGCTLNIVVTDALVLSLYYPTVLITYAWYWTNSLQKYYIKPLLRAKLV